MDLNLTDRVAIVTGGASGIGSAIAFGLAAEGCRVWIADCNAKAGIQVAADLTERGSRVKFVDVDVTVPSSVSHALNQVLRQDGRIDILVCNAGAMTMGPFENADLEDWDRLCRVNLSALVYCAKAVFKTMQTQQSGRIINMASISAMRGGGSIGNTMYGTTKAGVVALTKGLAREMGQFGVTVNAIAPAVVDTPMTHEALTDEVRKKIRQRIPLGRLTLAEEVADLVAFLASDRAAFISGTTIPVDGGILTT